jgi:hypothetical protein
VVEAYDDDYDEPGNFNVAVVEDCVGVGVGIVGGGEKASLIKSSNFF